MRPQDKTQITMIVVWVIELFLNQLGELRDCGKANSSEYKEMQRHFEGFMNQRLVQVISATELILLW
jgi:vacuolar protein sorting-associated protein 18